MRHPGPSRGLAFLEVRWFGLFSTCGYAFLPIPLKPRIKRVRGHRLEIALVAAVRAHLPAYPVLERRFVELAGLVSPQTKALAQRIEMAGWIVGPEVRHGDPRRLPGLDDVHRREPQLHVDVRRRRRRQHRPVADAHAGDVTRERRPGRLVEVGDVMGRMTGRVLDLEAVLSLAARQHAHALLG